MCPIANLTGPPGANGATWYVGAGVPSSGLGVDGDLYLDNLNSYYYLKVSGAWVFQGQLAVTPSPAYFDLILTGSQADNFPVITDEFGNVLSRL